MGQYRLLRGEGSVLEQRGQDGPSQKDQAQRGRQANEDNQAQGPVQGPAELSLLPATGQGGQGGQDGRAQGDAEDPQGELHQAVGVIKEGHAALGQEGGQDGIDQDAHLDHAYGQHAWPHEADDAPDPGMARPEARPHRQP